VFTEPATARQEAERLVAAALAVASLAAGSHPELATGSAACCICPFCKLIEAVRDPDPQFVERLATGAGDLAVGVASLLRNLAPARAAGGQAAHEADPWRYATTNESRAAAAQTEPTAQAEPAAPKVAKRAVAKKAVAKKAAAKVPQPAHDAPAEAVKPVVKKAVAKKVVKKAMPRPRPEASG
jgi:hypothetical protein